ncbi:MAG TPA: hypothetical protein PKL83_05285 [bacterium]|nr:hypothetical protein [bacterium]
MIENQQDQKIKVVEMARKRRHIHLLEKLQRGQSSTPSLSKTEIKELEQLEQDPDSPGTVDSQEKVARVMGVDVRTVARWVKNGMPVTPQGLYDLLEIRAWRELKNQRKGTAGSKKETQEDLWDAKYREYKAKLAEIAFKKAMAELLPRDTVERELVQISLTVKRKMLALPNQISAALVGLEARQINSRLRARITEIISAFATGKVFTVTKERKRKKNASIDNKTQNLD